MGGCAAPALGTGTGGGGGQARSPPPPASPAGPVCFSLGSGPSAPLRLFPIPIFRAKSAADQVEPRYRSRAELSPFLSHCRVSLALWLIFKHSSYLFCCILKQGLFFSLSESEHRW